MRFKKMMRGIALLLMTVLLSVSVCPLVSHADKISDLKRAFRINRMRLIRHRMKRKRCNPA